MFLKSLIKSKHVVDFDHTHEPAPNDFSALEGMITVEGLEPLVELWFWPGISWERSSWERAS